MAVTEPYMLERCDKKTLRLACVFAQSCHIDIIKVIMKVCVATAKFMVEKNTAHEKGIYIYILCTSHLYVWRPWGRGYQGHSGA